MKPNKEKFQIDPNSRTWKILEEYIKVRMENLATKLGDIENGRAKDLVLKGQIMELRQMLSVGKPPPESKVQGMGNLQ